MSTVVHERPGVYSTYDISSAIWRGNGGKVVGLAALASQGEANQVVRVTSYEEGVAAFGQDSESIKMAALLRLLFLNGASEVKAVRVADESHYGDAFTALSLEEGIDIVICDSDVKTVQLLMRESIIMAADARRERIGIVGSVGESTAEMIERAAAINHERMVLVGGDVLDESGDVLGGIYAAAALAGRLSQISDPAVPVNGETLEGFGGVSTAFSDNQIDQLIRGGVTPLETVSGVVSVVRGITTRTTTDDVEDTTWRELTTILIVDDVIPAVRNALRSRFSRKKNTAQTRGAIRSQVIMELENKRAAEIIESYGDVAVSVDSTDPTVCLVEFSFGVAHGLNQIYLTAHITV